VTRVWQPSNPGGTEEVRDRLISVGLAAQRLGIGRSTMYDLIRRGELPAVRLGRRVLVSSRFVEEKISEAARPDDRDPR
jgi:excisionase family DNA binding protein